MVKYLESKSNDYANNLFLNLNEGKPVGNLNKKVKVNYNKYQKPWQKLKTKVDIIVSEIVISKKKVKTTSEIKNSEEYHR